MCDQVTVCVGDSWGRQTAGLVWGRQGVTVTTDSQPSAEVSVPVIAALAFGHTAFTHWGREGKRGAGGGGVRGGVVAAKISNKLPQILP